MCFSATASFIAGTGLLAIGVIAIKRSKNTPQYVLACIPVVFAIQQFTEGLLWLAISEAEYARWRQLAMYLFLIFAQIVWPILVPTSILLFEKDRLRKKILYILLGSGVLAALYLGYSLIYYGATATIENHHIKYQLDFPFSGKVLRGIPYMLATAISPFISSNKWLRLLGWALAISYVFTAFMYIDYLTSVWCYFGAILSALILFIIRKTSYN
ncbi:MAG TPA: DUF6629 family protein [Pedobacter sp.]|uniref:DUF6629 family protein n=1 Tax=Pedobacter sp. TaxID=1411316 RepID=UPI002CA288F5|nr:DUF6629 family protein [Pedobacter sp.]HMI02194.1 DUF6629 family protein [Pedobacter sp.]